jgi:hypothetical protein
VESVGLAATITGLAIVLRTCSEVASTGLEIASFPIDPGSLVFDPRDFGGIAEVFRYGLPAGPVRVRLLRVGKNELG